MPSERLAGNESLESLKSLLRRLEDLLYDANRTGDRDDIRDLEEQIEKIKKKIIRLMQRKDYEEAYDEAPPSFIPTSTTRTLPKVDTHAQFIEDMNKLFPPQP